MSEFPSPAENPSAVIVAEPFVSVIVSADPVRDEVSDPDPTVTESDADTVLKVTLSAVATVSDPVSDSVIAMFFPDTTSTVPFWPTR